MRPKPCSASAVVLLVVLSGCALSAPPAEATLGAAATPDEPDRAAQDALRAARAAPTAIALQRTAAERLFQAADHRLQQATLLWLDAHPQADRAAVVAAADHVDPAAQQAILSLATAGLECAERVVAAAPGDVAGHLLVGLHVGLLAWANGPARSALAGYGGRIVAATKAALDLDRDFDRGAVLRLHGRFRSQAPWPYGDRKAACADLARAVELAPLVVNHLFYGDALALAGDPAGAERQWQAAVLGEVDASTRWSADLLRELARRRLQARR